MAQEDVLLVLQEYLSTYLSIKSVLMYSQHFSMLFLLSEGHFLPKQSVWEPDSGDSRKFAVLENGGVGD